MELHSRTLGKRRKLTKQRLSIPADSVTNANNVCVKFDLYRLGLYRDNQVIGVRTPLAVVCIHHRGPDGQCVTAPL